MRASDKQRLEDKVNEQAKDNDMVAEFDKQARALVHIVLENQKLINDMLAASQMEAVSRERLAQFESLVALTNKTQSMIKAYPEVRRALLALQNSFAAKGELDAVTEATGRASEMAQELLSKMKISEDA